MYYFGPYPYLGSDGSAYVLAAAINTQQLRTLAADAQDKGPFLIIHTIVLIGNAANKGSDREIGAVPSGYLR
jgi:hypothetical protein